MKRKYFGTDGIRGKVGVAPVTPDFVLRLAHAVGRVLKTQSSRPTVLIGKDTRISGYMLESALESGFNSAGVDVVLLGPIPTPAVAYLTRAQRASLGVVISASHNPFEDNGIKFFSSTGSKMSDEWELEVEQMLLQEPQWVEASGLGKARRLNDAAGRYVEFCKATFDSDLSLKGLKIVVDAAHGAAYQVAPLVFHELGAQVVSLGCEPDGLNINHEVGATHPQALVAEVIRTRADFGFALDGDADRLQLVDAKGRLFNGDELLYLLASDRWLQQQSIAGVVGTLMTNMAIELAFKQKQVAFERANVGDRYVLELLEKHGWILGGEGSGHLLVLDKQSTGDGLVNALQVLQACIRNGLQPADMLQGIELFPQTLINLKIPSGFNWQQSAELQKTRQEVEAMLKGQGRVLIRPSGTEPLLRIMVEAADAGLAHACAQKLVDSLQ